MTRTCAQDAKRLLLILSNFWNRLWHAYNIQKHFPKQFPDGISQVMFPKSSRNKAMPFWHTALAWSLGIMPPRSHLHTVMPDPEQCRRHGITILKNVTFLRSLIFQGDLTQTVRTKVSRSGKRYVYYHPKWSGDDERRIWLWLNHLHCLCWACCWRLPQSHYYIQE